MAYDWSVWDQEDLTPELTATIEETERYEPERGGLMDIVSALTAGTASAFDMLGAATGSESVRGIGDYLSRTSIAKPDTSRYFRTQGWAEKIRDDVVTSVPQLVGQLALPAAGFVLGGVPGAIYGAAAGLGVLTKGSYVQAFEEIDKEQPDLSAEDKTSYALKVSFSEAVGGLVDYLIPAAGNLSAPARGALVDSFLKSGFSVKDLTKMYVTEKGGFEATKYLFGSIIAEGYSEVVTELMQSAAREQYGLEPTGNSLLDVFVVGSILGGAIAGPTVFNNVSNQNKLKERIDSGLTSEDTEVRLETVGTILSGISNIHPEVADAYKLKLEEAARSGPVTLDTILQQETQLTEIIDKPEAILEANGIPTGKPTVAAKPIEEYQKSPFEQRLAGLSGKLETVEGTPLQPVEKAYSPELPERVQEAYRLDLKLEEAARLEVEDFMEASRDYRISKNEELVGMDSQEADRYMEAIRKSTDNKARQEAIRSGMREVSSISNELLVEGKTLEERKTLKTKLKKTTDLIDEEVAEVLPKKKVPTTVQPTEPTTALETTERALPATITEEPIQEVVQAQLDVLERSKPSMPEDIAAWKEEVEELRSQIVEPEAIPDRPFTDSQLKTLEYAVSKGVDIEREGVRDLVRKYKGTPEGFVNSLKVPQEVSAVVSEGSTTVRYHDGTTLEYNPKADPSARAKITYKGNTYRSTSLKNAKAAIAEGSVTKLESYEKKVRSYKKEDIGKLTAEKKRLLQDAVSDPKFIKDLKGTSKIPTEDLLIALTETSTTGKAFNEDNSWNYKEIRKEAERISNRESKRGTRGVKTVRGLEEEIQEGSKVEESTVGSTKYDETPSEVTYITDEKLKAEILERQKKAKRKEHQALSLETLLFKESVMDNIADEDLDLIYDKWVTGDPLADISRFDSLYPDGPNSRHLREVRGILQFEVEANPEAVAKTFKASNGLELIDKVISTGSKEQVALAEAMKKATSDKLKNIKVQLDMDRASSSYRSGLITIAPHALASPTVWIHELQHSVTLQEMENNKELRDKVEEYRRYLRRAVESRGLLSKEQLAVVDKSKTSQEFKDNSIEVSWTEETASIAYALMNNSEFLAQAYSIPHVMNLMKTVEYRGDSTVTQRIKNLWDDFVSAVSKALGLPTEYRSLLEAVLSTSRELYEVPVGRRAPLPESHSLTPEERAMTTDEITRGILASRVKGSAIKDSLRKFGKEASVFAAKALVPIADRIKMRSEKIYGALMKHEAEITLNQTRYSNLVKPFFKWYNEKTDSEQVRISVGLMSRDRQVWDEMPSDIRKGLEEALKGMADEAIGVGLLDEHKDLYFPMRVADINKLSELVMQESENKGIIGIAIRERAETLGVPVESLTQADKVQIVADMLQSGQINQLPRPGSTKKRTIFKVTKEYFPLYQSPVDALTGHIFEMTEKIGMRKMAGGSIRKGKLLELKKLSKEIEGMEEGPEKVAKVQQWDSLNEGLSDLEKDLEEGIAGLVQEEMKGESAESQRLVMDMLRSRMMQKGAHGILDVARNVGYAATMGNFMSAITQLSDIPIVFYRYGLNADTMGAVLEAFRDVGKIIAGKKTDAFVEHMDFTNALREFSQGKLSAKALEVIFKYSGLKYADLVGKEATMKAAMKSYQRSRNKGKFLKKYEPFFGDRVTDVLRDIQLGKKTDDVKTVMLSELAEYQPVTMSQQSEYYLGGGNWRALYSLKTFTLRTTSAAVREGYTLMKEGKYIKGALRFSSILLIYAFAGAGTDELKDLLRGKQSSVSDNVQDNLLQMFFLSKYTVEKGIEKDRLLQGIIESLIPPVRHADSFVSDLYALASDEKDFKAKTLTSVPLIGTIAYGRSEAGQEGYANQERRAILEDIKRNAKGKKPPRSGGVSDRIRQYRRSFKDSEPINEDTIMRAYRGVN